MSAEVAKDPTLIPEYQQAIQTGVCPKCTKPLGSLNKAVLIPQTNSANASEVYCASCHTSFLIPKKQVAGVMQFVGGQPQQPRPRN